MVRKNLDWELIFNKDKKYNLIAGIDESGRGSLIGPIVIAAVILPNGFQDSRLQDSKTLSTKQKNLAYELIIKEALSYNILSVSQTDIELKNPTLATLEGFKKMIEGLSIQPDICLLDGKDELSLSIPVINIIKGDGKAINIAAASILAKVTRDKMINDLHRKYPMYDWDKNKGYLNKSHLLSILSYGLCVLHRKNYQPIKFILSSNYDLKKLLEKYKKLLK